MANDGSYHIEIILEGENKLSPTVKSASNDLRKFADDSTNASNATSALQRSVDGFGDTMRMVMGGAVMGGWNP